MIDKLKSKLKELVSRKKELQPKIDEVNSKREIELQNVNKKFDHMVYDVNYNIQKIEDEFYNDLIRSFVEIVTREFDIKRSTDIYEITDNFKTYRKLIADFDMFPKELIQKLHTVINGEPIEEIVYELDDIQNKYMKS
ncbi:hypothetical protein LCGC14_2593880 [marine sediment metagenome]|uniref:Uncharacterized protein n=1 Tax=marine sediment metagenome TaxID=412755 RepID=A0A0F9D3F4_9ZZZZ